MNWIYDNNQEAWISGDTHNGCGVFTDDGGWTWNANIVVNGDWTMSDGHDTMEDAKKIAEQEFKRLIEEYNIGKDQKS